ncbi:MAG: NACHT domain-containing protein [Gammaproteobacteria bacterium]
MSKDNLIKALKTHYSQSASFTASLGAKDICRQFAGDAWPIASSFIRLAILLSSEEGDKTRPTDKQAEEKDSSHPSLDRSLALERYEDTRAVKTPLELDQLFNPLPEAKDKVEHQIRRKVWILGRAGVGKTTLTQRLAYEWANSEDSDWVNQPRLFKQGAVTATSSADEPIVIWIKLRAFSDYLNCLQETNNLPEKRDKTVLVMQALSMFVIDKLLLTDEINIDELNDKVIQRILQENKTNSLYLLDGYDEIASLADNHPARQVCDYLLSMPWVVVTSRPYADVPDNRKREFRRIEIVGFSKENALRYIEQHFDKQSPTPQQIELTQLVKTNANIQGIAVIPVNMEILCAIAQATIKTADIQRFASLSISDIYLEVLVFIFRRYHQNPANHSSMQKQWDKLNEEDILEDMENRGVLPILSRLAKDLFVKNHYYLMQIH